MFLSHPQIAQATHPAMGTVMAHKAYGIHADAGLLAIQAEIDRLEGLLSRFLPDSDISRINASAGVRCQEVAFDTFEVLSTALDFSRRFTGFFDLTIAPLVAVWNIGRGGEAEPDEACIRQALALVNYHDLLLDPAEMTAGLRHAGQAVDLGGIGKGYAGDRILEVYREVGVTSAYSNLGGNVVTLGTRPDGSPWRVGIQHPRQTERLLGSVSVADQAVVTSGDYQRFFTGIQGARRHHILSPETGYPVESGLVSVTVVAGRAVEADALSTAILAAGLKKGLEFLEAIPHAEAILVGSDMQMYVTRGLRFRFQAEAGLNVTLLD